MQKSQGAFEIPLGLMQAPVFFQNPGVFAMPSINADLFAKNEHLYETGRLTVSYMFHRSILSFWQMEQLETFRVLPLCLTPHTTKRPKQRPAQVHEDSQQVN